MAVDLKLIAGNLATSKKSPDRRWLSRCSTPVSTLLASMVAVISVSRPSAPVSAVAVNWRKRPFTVAMPRCLTLNSTWVWAASMFHCMVCSFSFYMSLAGSGRRGRPFANLFKTANHRGDGPLVHLTEQVLVELPDDRIQPGQELLTFGGQDGGHHPAILF